MTGTAGAALLRFLRSGRRDPFIGASWPTDTWIEAADGLVAYEVAHLPRWLAHELWVVEVDGPITVRDYSVVAPRARLVRRVERWDRITAADFVRFLTGRHPDLPYTPSTESWTPAWEAAYVAAHTAGMDAEERGEDYRRAEDADWTAQAAWLAGRLDLAFAVA